MSDGAPILVTGATGTVGVEVVRALRAAGHPVRAASRAPARDRAALLRALALPDGRPALAPPRADDPPPLADDPGLASVALDVTDRATWPAALAGAGSLFLLRPPQVHDADGALNPFVDAAVAAGVRHVVFLSVQGAERNVLVPHHAVERHLERLAAEGHATHTFLRAAFFAQNLATAHRAELRERGTLVIPAGDGRTAFVDARDVARVAALALARPAAHANRAYTLTSGESLTYHEVAAILTRTLGRPIRYARPGPLAFWRHRRALGDAPGFVLVMEGLYLTARLGLAGAVSGELAELLRAVGRTPLTMAAFAHDHADVWR